MGETVQLESAADGFQFAAYHAGANLQARVRR